MEVGDKVNFRFQGRWSVNLEAQVILNIGKLVTMRQHDVIAQSGNGARFYLSRDDIRKVKE